MNDTCPIDSQKSDSATAFRNASTLHDLGKFAEAEEVLRQAIVTDPTNADLWNARGVMFAAMAQYTSAIRCYREALARDPGGPGIWTNLGNALTHTRQLKTAIACHHRALALSAQPDALLHHNLGTSLVQARHHGEAIIAFSRALEIKPNYHMARWDRGLSYLSLGNYPLGWLDYEARFVTGQLPVRALPGTRWSGEPYPGKRLLLGVEQGFGDTLWAARYLPKVKALGGELFVECQRELIPLLEGMGAADHFIPAGDVLPEADLHCYLCSIPGLFTSDFDSIPNAPYISPPQDRIAKFQSIFSAAGRRLKVGIVWSGSITFKKNHERAQRLVRFMPAFNMPEVQLYSLQKGPAEAALTQLPDGAPIIDLAPLLADFADTAAAVSQLDLVIMTDSVVAHLAGAMGKPVWVLLGYNAHWLWLLDRADSPWYPSMRLFRPRAPGDWSYVFDSAALELMNLGASRR